MPFKSEKQRRYLHANHPEIAKRWERDYANGGITLPKGPAGITSLNGWGSKDSSQNKAGADISASMDKNPNDPGWGGGGGDGPPSIKNPPKGPTAEEIAAAKAKAEAEKRRLEAEARKKYVKDFKDTQKKKFSWTDNLKNFGNKLTNITDSTLALGTPFATYFTGGKWAPRTPGMDKNLKDIIESKMKVHSPNYPSDFTKESLSGTIGYSDYDKSQVTGASMPNLETVAKDVLSGKISPQEFANMTTMGRLTYNVDPQTKEITLGSNEYNFRPEVAEDTGYFAELANKTNRAIEPDLTLQSGGVARKKYSTGTNGILDIDEESEDISLTAFNPKFDDVPELTEEKEEEKINLFSETEESDPLNELLLAEDGVTTLFRAKNGGYAVQGGVKNYLGEQKMVHAPKYWQSAPDHPETELTYITKPEKDLLVKADLHGSLHGSVNKGPQGLASLNGWGDAGDFDNDKGEISSDSGWSPGVSHSGMPSDTGAVTSDAGWDNSVAPNVTTVTGGDIWDWDDTSEIDDVYETFENVKHRYDKNKTTQGWKMVFNMLTGNLGGVISTGYGMHKDKKAYEEMLEKLKQDAIDLGIPMYNPHTDTLVQTIDQEVIDINKKRDTETQDTDEDGPVVAPVMQEIQEYEKMAWDPMSYLDKIRAGQAQRAALQAKGIIQDNEIMTLNSGGLANLFTVKNYN